MARLRLALQKAQRILDRIDQRPAQLEQLATGPSGKDKSRQRSASGRSTLGQLATKLDQGHRFATLDLGETRLQRGESVRIGKNLGGLLQCLVLVNRNQGRRNQGRRRSPIAGDQHVIPPNTDVIEQAASI